MKHQVISATICICSVIFFAGCQIQPSKTPLNSSLPTETTIKSTEKTPDTSMAPVTPPELTEEQKLQLKAGEQAHKPAILTFTVVGGKFFYVPNQIKVKKGDTVKIVFQNSGGMHNFVLDEFNIKGKTITTGETDSIEFIADKVGTFQYYCSVGQHRKLGQQGTLIVE